LKLEKLKPGQEIQVVNEAGQTFTYEVKTVQNVNWKKRDIEELAQHWAFLSPEGRERLTLVTCAGAKSIPFPERVYVVADPVR
jgi:sortase (surface protein transpeptidase)